MLRVVMDSKENKNRTVFLFGFVTGAFFIWLMGKI